MLTGRMTHNNDVKPSDDRAFGDQISGDERMCGVLASPVGPLLIVVSDIGVCRVDFLSDGEAKSLGSHTGEPHQLLSEAITQISEYFAYQRTDFSLPLDLRGTEFQKQAWLSLAAIPYGNTITYGEQAAGIGRPRAVRAIGAANGRNPIAIVLPCHRVIGADGSLTGYAGGMDKKKWLLQHETSR